MTIQHMTHDEFKKNHKNHTFWNDVVKALLEKENIEYHSFTRYPMGGNIVYRVDDQLVLKLFSPFDSREYFIETEVLEKTDWSKVSVEVPQIINKGTFDGWHYLLMKRVPGKLLLDVWSELSQDERIGVASDLGKLIEQMHGLNISVYNDLDRSFDEWISGQKKNVQHHHEKTGLAPHLINELLDFVSSYKPSGKEVLLTGEYTPFNLMVNSVDDRWTLTGLIDFADCFIGEPLYDLLGPILFNFYKEPGLTRAFIDAYGIELTDPMRVHLMQLLLLHRFSHLPNYMEGEIEMNDVETLNALSKKFFSYNRHVNSYSD
jgi:hygromycin-B 7''-O-kinase